MEVCENLSQPKFALTKLIQNLPYKNKVIDLTNTIQKIRTATLIE